MRLIVGSFVAGEIHVVHVEKETLRAGGHVGPAHGRRGALANGNAGSGLTELNGDLAAVGEIGNSQSHGGRRRGATLALTSAAGILREQQERRGSNDCRNEEQSHGSILPWNGKAGRPREEGARR